MRLIVAALACLWAISAQGASLLYVPGPAQIGPRPALMAGPPSAGGSGCTAATNYLARTTGGNEGGNATNITTLICGLVTDGVITGNLSGATGCGAPLDALYILAQQNVADAKLNLCGTSYTLPTNTATFTLYQGYSAFPANGLDTGFSATLAISPNFIQDSASVGAWVYDTPNAGVQIGSDVTSTGTVLVARYSDVNNYCGVNSADGGGTFPYSGIGLFVCDRQNSSGINFYYNGSSLGVVVQGSSTVTSIDMAIGDVRVGGFAITTTISEAHIGGSLGSSLNLALYTRLRTYMTAVGVP